MKLLHTTRLTLAAGLLALTAASAQAATIKLNYSNNLQGTTTGSITGTGSIYAGEFDFSTSDNATDIIEWDESLSAFCIQIDETLKSSATYSVTEGLDGFSDYQGGLINRLFTHFYEPDLDDTQSTAFQLALWEITNEVMDFGLDLDGGLFTSTSFGGAKDIANAWLMDLSDLQSSTKYTFHTLTNSKSQNLLTVTQASVPEPGTLFLMSAGLFALFRARRRTR